MAGIYIHIPFCKKACFYCDFHFSVSYKNKTQIVQAISKELIARKSFIAFNESIDTVYFGGGTPSVLSISELRAILDTVRSNYLVAKNAEISYECNPDDLSLSYLEALKGLGINRLSIGIQSFEEDHLVWMNRSHTSKQSLQCVLDASEVGFTDITIDLIYGLPQLSEKHWEQTVQQALDLPINHLSAYSLTMEDNTPYRKLVKQRKYKKPNNDASALHYEILNNLIRKNNWEQYEVSNYCKSGNYSKHNTAYWQNKKYLGIGPSAHSFDGDHRYWNVSSNTEYLARIENDKNVCEQEKLSNTNRINEVLLTGLRTRWGVNIAQLSTDYQYDIAKLFTNELEQWISKKWITLNSDNLTLTSEGLLFADYIASELFAEDKN